MPKPEIPESGVVLGRPGEIARFELAAQSDSIFTSTKLRLALLGAFAFLALDLLVAGAQNLHQVNTQGEACILLAKHYADGDFILAISSYWSPLLSWLLALGLKAGGSGLAAARLLWRLCCLGGLFCLRIMAGRVLVRFGRLIALWRVWNRRMRSGIILVLGG